MKKQLLNVETLEPDHILTTDIYHYNTDVVLYTKGTILTNEKINRLKNFGDISIYVETDDIYEKPIEVVRRKIELDIDEIYRYANIIVSDVIKKNNLRKIFEKVEENVFDHSHKVATLSAVLGINIESIGESELESLVISALLHDIGKSTIDFSILNKPGKLTAEEYEIIKTHAQSGYDILKATDSFDEDICEAVLCHHENEDGTGYPNGIKNDEIPLFARIIHVCDVYAALTAKRHYKEAWTSEQAIIEMNNNYYKYNKDILEILKLILPHYIKDDTVLLSTNDLATIVHIDNTGLLVKLFGTNGIYRIDYENQSTNSVYIKRKIKTPQNIHMLN